MRSVLRIFLLLFTVSFFSGDVFSQASQICSDTGGKTVWLTSSVVYGEVKLIGAEKAGRFPKVSVTMISGARIVASAVIDKTGTYCFRDVDGSGATISLEIEGREVGREVLENVSPNAPKQFRRDFEIEIGGLAGKPKPAVISAKYPYERSDQLSKLYEEGTNALHAKDLKSAERNFSDIVKADKADFWAWAKLGSIYLDRSEFPAAEKAFLESLAAKGDFAPSMISLGQVYLLQKQFEKAIETLTGAAKLDRDNARAFQLLGESYLMIKKGSLGVVALNEAIRLDPVGMAECHLLIALLYDRAGAKNFASREYRMFLEKVPNHPDAKKFAKYVQDNPDTP